MLAFVILNLINQFSGLAVLFQNLFNRQITSDKMAFKGIGKMLYKLVNNIVPQSPFYLVFFVVLTAPSPAITPTPTERIIPVAISEDRIIDNRRRTLLIKKPIS